MSRADVVRVDAKGDPDRGDFELRELVARFVVRAVADLDALLAQHPTPTEPLRAAAAAIAHRLAGSCGTFGLAAPAALARDLERRALGGERLAILREDLERLHQAITRCGPPPAAIDSGAAPAPSEVVAESREAATVGLRILCIEDDPDIAFLLKTTLLLDGNVVEVVADGVLGWERMCGEAPPDFAPPDLVLLDLSLPGLTGDEILLRRAAHVRASRIPVLVLSARLLGALPITGEAGRGVAWLPKPFDVAELRRRLVELVVAERAR